MRKISLIALHPNRLKSWFSTSSATLQLFRPRLGPCLLALPLALVKKSAAPSCRIPSFSVCLGISLSAASLHAQSCYCPSNDIVFFADYAYLTRSGIRDFRLVENTTNPNDPFKIIDTEDVVESMGDESAIKAGILWDRNIDRSLEVFYTYVLPWHTTKKIKDVGVLSYPLEE